MTNRVTSNDVILASLDRVPSARFVRSCRVWIARGLIRRPRAAGREAGVPPRARQMCDAFRNCAGRPGGVIVTAGAGPRRPVAFLGRSRVVPSDPDGAGGAGRESPAGVVIWCGGLRAVAAGGDTRLS